MGQVSGKSGCFFTRRVAMREWINPVRYVSQNQSFRCHVSDFFEPTLQVLLNDRYPNTKWSIYRTCKSCLHHYFKAKNMQRQEWYETVKWRLNPCYIISHESLILGRFPNFGPVPTPILEIKMPFHCPKGGNGIRLSLRAYIIFIQCNVQLSIISASHETSCCGSFHFQSFACDHERWNGTRMISVYPNKSYKFHPNSHFLDKFH